MKAAELDSALSALSGRPCKYSSLVQNRTRFFLGLGFALLVGVATGVLIRQWLVGSIVFTVLVAIAQPLADRRFIGITADGLVQAKSTTWIPRPTELLAPLQFSDVHVLSIGFQHDNAAFRIDGTAYLSTKNSGDLARHLKIRNAASPDRA